MGKSRAGRSGINNGTPPTASLLTGPLQADAVARSDRVAEIARPAFKLLQDYHFMMRKILANVAILTTCFASALALTPLAARAEALPPATPLQKLSGTEKCDRCIGWLLPGKLTPHPETKYGMISDLPETFGTYGVLYSTTDTLPANGGAPELLKQRKSGGFTTIDDSFDVFIFHLSKITTMTARIVVEVENKGREEVTIEPGQVIRTEGIIGTVHEFESIIAKRVLENDWDKPLPTVTIPPGEGRVIAYGKQFGSAIKTPGPDASRNVNCFGYVRAKVKPAKDATPNLQVKVIVLPASPIEEIPALVQKYKYVGAVTTDEVSLTSEPQDCALKRAVGVYRNPIWRNDRMVIDVSTLETSGVSFPMALAKIQTMGCPDARQTADLVLRPGYTREDTIGNYMMEYDVRLTLTNSSNKPQVADLTFGKGGADIGLAYQNHVSKSVNAPENPYVSAPVVWKWAGPKQAARERSLLDAPLTIPAGGVRTVSTRFLIVGNSSLPFDLNVRPFAVPEPPKAQAKP